MLYQCKHMQPILIAAKQAWTNIKAYFTLLDTTPWGLSLALTI